MKFTDENSPTRAAMMTKNEEVKGAGHHLETLDLLRTDNWRKYEEALMEVVNVQVLIQASPGGHAVWKIPHLERQISFLGEVIKNMMAIDEEKSRLKTDEHAGGGDMELKVCARPGDDMADLGTDVVEKLDALQSSVDEMRQEIVEIWKYLKRENAPVFQGKKPEADVTVVTEDTVDKGVGPMTQTYSFKENVGTEVQRTYTCSVSSVSSAASGDYQLSEKIDQDAGPGEGGAGGIGSSSGLYVKDDFKKRVKESVELDEKVRKHAATEFKRKVASSLSDSPSVSSSEENVSESGQDFKSPVKEFSPFDISPKMVKPKLVPRPCENEADKSATKTVDETKKSCESDEQLIKAILDPLFDTTQELAPGLLDGIVNLLESTADSVDWTPFVKFFVSRSIENSAAAQRGADDICNRFASSERIYSRIKPLLIERCQIEYLSCLENISGKSTGKSDIAVRSWMGLIWFLARLSSNIRNDIVGIGAVDLMQNIISMYEPLSKMKGCLRTTLKVLQYLEPHIVSRKAIKFVTPLKQFIAVVKQRAKGFDMLMPEEQNLAKTLENLLCGIIIKIV